jgi:hypothetical protein
MYCAGWIKGGPVGVIDQTFASSQETIVNLKNHILAKILPSRDDPRGTINALSRINHCLVEIEEYPIYKLLGLVKSQ